MAGRKRDSATARATATLYLCRGQWQAAHGTQPQRALQPRHGGSSRLGLASWLVGYPGQSVAVVLVGWLVGYSGQSVAGGGWLVGYSCQSVAWWVGEWVGLGARSPHGAAGSAPRAHITSCQQASGWVSRSAGGWGWGHAHLTVLLVLPRILRPAPHNMHVGQACRHTSRGGSGMQAQSTQHVGGQARRHTGEG